MIQNRTNQIRFIRADAKSTGFQTALHSEGVIDFMYYVDTH